MTTWVMDASNEGHHDIRTLGVLTPRDGADDEAPHRHVTLHKSRSTGNLSRLSESTEPTASFSDADSVDDQRLTVSQIGSFFTEGGGERRRLGWNRERELPAGDDIEEDSTIRDDEDDDNDGDDAWGNDDVASHLATAQHRGDGNGDMSLSDSSLMDPLPPRLPNGIPSEVIVIKDSVTSFVDAGSISNSNNLVAEGGPRIQLYDTLLATYRKRLESSEGLNDSLHEYLRQTQGYAEDLLSQRQELIAVLEQMDNDENRRNDQELLLKGIVCCSLLFYLAGGSNVYLVAAVVLQLFVSVVNLVL